MNYIEALEFAESGQYGHFEEEDYFENLLLLFDHPQRHEKIIHIAGTNGKGTTGFYLMNLLMNEGFKVGHLTSPHLTDYRERIKQNNILIDKESFIQASEKVNSKKDEILASMRWPTYFEMAILIGILALKDKVDYIILETGIGGLKDITNQVGNTVLSIITTIHKDHTEMLGKTLPEIAYHKAGIIKENIPVVTFKHSEVVDRVLEKVASEKSAPIYFISTEKIEEDNGFSKIPYNESWISLKMPGLHQGANALLAIKAAEILLGKTLKDINVLSEIQLEGRMETLKTKPRFLVDGAHNSEGIENLIFNLKKLSYKRLILIIGFMKDKDLAEFEKLQVLADILILTKIEYDRAKDPEKILESLKREKNYYVFNELGEGLSFAVEEAQEEDLILATGSLYLIGEIRKIIKEMEF